MEKLEELISFRTKKKRTKRKGKERKCKQYQQQQLVG